jgi:hypothetical protein
MSSVTNLYDDGHDDYEALSYLLIELRANCVNIIVVIGSCPLGSIQIISRKNKEQ